MDNVIKLDIQPDAAQVKHWGDTYKGLVKHKEFNQALANAVNRALTHGKTRFKEEIAKRYAIKSSYVLSMMRVRNAYADNPSGEIIFSSARLALTKFNVKPDPSKKMPSQKGQSWTSRKRPTIEVVRGQQYTSGSAFIAKMKSGHIGVYSRNVEKQAKSRPGNLTKHTQRIEERTGSSIVTMAAKEEIREGAWSSVSVELFKRIDHEMKRLAYK